MSLGAIATNPLYQELIAQGFHPQLDFQNDTYEKVLYLQNTQTNTQRMSLNGKVKVPTTTLVNQNPTLKTTDLGVRVKFNAAAGTQP